MKKLSSILALALCLVLCAFCFASCGKKKATDATTGNQATAPATTASGDSTKASQTTGTATQPEATEPEATEPEATEPEATEPEATEPEVTEPQHEHTPEADYVITLDPTCCTPGEKTLYCEECGDELDVQEVPIDPEAHLITEWTVTKESTLFDGEGLMEGTCVYCDQPFEKSYSSIIEKKYTTTPIADSDRLFYEQNIYSELLNEGEIHFYPNDEDPDGKDLYVEFSFLWNATFENLGSDAVGGGHPVIDTRLDTSKRDKGKGNDLAWMALKNGASGSDCPFAGGFEYGSLRTVEVGPAGMSTRTDGGSRTAYADYPNIGGNDQANPEWGWHRIGVRFHQEVSNADALKADETPGATAATYYFFVETYIDGNLVSRLSNAATTQFGPSTAIFDEKGDNRLFVATSDGEGGITYEDGGENCHILGIRAPFYNTEKDAAYLVFADYYATAGDGFVQNVSRVATPEANTYVAEDGTEIPAPIYYRIND